MVGLTDFVLAQLPPPPARILEVGCGEGELALALAAAAYDVVAIDPYAPEGEIFRQNTLDELDEDERFDAVVASRVFHHVPDLDGSLARVGRILEGGGPFVADEFAWDLLDGATADWYDAQRRVLAAAGHEPRGPSAAEWRHHHRERHAVHEAAALRDALDRHFVERSFERVPYLWRYLGGASSLDLEEALIAAGAIRALGFRFVGIPRVAVTLGT